MRRSLRALFLTGLTIGLLGGDIASLSFAPAAAEAHWRRGGGFGYGYGYGMGAAATTAISATTATAPRSAMFSRPRR